MAHTPRKASPTVEAERWFLEAQVAYFRRQAKHGPKPWRGLYATRVAELEDRLRVLREACGVDPKNSAAWDRAQGG